MHLPRSNKLGATHLVIPDAHVKPYQDLRRFDWLGQLIMDTRPDTIICLGDFADMPSLSSYDKGQRKFEGRRYKLDVESSHKAQERLFYELNKYNKRRSKHHEKQYKPRKIMLLGNHEQRIERATQLEAQFHGTFGVEDLKFKEHGWEVYGFLDEIEVDGVTYSHYMVSGVMARPIGGEHLAYTLLAKQHKSCTVGHTHLADWSQRRMAGGKHLMGLVAGCFFEHDEDYVPRSVNGMYWRGVVLKNNVCGGVYDPWFVSMNTLKKIYG